MAEEENKKKGRLATAVLAGSALAFSSFAIGAPAALAQDAEAPERSASSESPSPTPEGEEPSVVEEATVEPETTDVSDDESNQGDVQSAKAEEGEESSEDAEEEDGASASSDTASGEPAPLATGNTTETPPIEDDEIQLSLSESQVVQGGSIIVTGENFTPDGNVTLSWDAESVEFQADGNGEISRSLEIPEDAEPGTSDVTVTDKTSSDSTTRELTVTEDDETPVVDPEISLDTNEAYPGEVIMASGSGFTPNQDVVLGLGSQVITAQAGENGEINELVEIPTDLAARTYDFTALDVESEQEATTEITLLEASEPALRISPEEITLDDFIRNSEDEDADGGVVHTVVGLEPGAEIDAVVEGPEGVESIDRDETANENGIAEFVIYGYDIDDPTNYLGVYDSEITIVDGEGEPLQGNFEVVPGEDDDDNGDETPVVDPDIDLNVDNAYPGETVSVSGSGFSADGDVEFSINPPVGETVANADGAFNAEVTIPEDIDPGEHTFTALDVESGDEATADFTVNDPADQVTEPALSVDPERIELDDFIGEEGDDNGVVHTVVGLEAGADFTYAVSGPEGVNDFEQSGTANEDGVAEFVIHGYEVSNPAVYLGDYTTVVNSVDQDGADVELTGNFSVVSGDGGAGDGSGDGGSGDYTGDPVDMNGSEALAQTGATSGQLGLIAGALLLMGGAFVVFANRTRLFGRKH